MKMDINNLSKTFGRYKKLIVIGGISFVAIVSLLLISMGVVVYKTTAIATEKVKAWNAAEVLPNGSVPEPGFIEEVVRSVASGWLEQGLASSRVKSVTDGLSCFDALGGPSPVDIVIYAKSQTTDENLLFQLNGLKETLATTAAPHNGTAACARWILNS